MINILYNERMVYYGNSILIKFRKERERKIDKLLLF